MEEPAAVTEEAADNQSFSKDNWESQPSSAVAESLQEDMNNFVQVCTVEKNIFLKFSLLYQCDTFFYFFFISNSFFVRLYQPYSLTRNVKRIRKSECIQSMCIL